MVGAHDGAVVTEAVIPKTDLGRNRAERSWRQGACESGLDVAIDTIGALHDTDHVSTRISINKLSLGDERKQPGDLARGSGEVCHLAFLQFRPSRRQRLAGSAS